MRQTIKDIQVNVAYRWFLGYYLTDEIVHFTTYSKNCTRRFKGTKVFENIFSQVLMQAIEQELVDTKIQFVDSTHVKSHANRHKNHKQEVIKKAKAYQRQLEEENTLKKLLKNITYEKTMIIFKKNKNIYIHKTHKNIFCGFFFTLKESR